MKWLTLSPASLLRQIHLLPFFERIVVRAEDRVHAFFWACVRISLSVSWRRGNWLPPFILLFKWEEKDFYALWSEFNGSQIIHFWASSLASFRSLAFISVSFSGRVYLAPIGTPWSDGGNSYERGSLGRSDRRDSLIQQESFVLFLALAWQGFFLYWVSLALGFGIWNRVFPFS